MTDDPTNPSTGERPNLTTKLLEPVPAYPTDKFDREKFKASGAQVVALLLVLTFAATIAAIFYTIALIYLLSASPSQAKDFVAAFTGVIPVMENFITKIFGPLLAFVLGYYFGEKATPTSAKA